MKSPQITYGRTSQHLRLLVHLKQHKDKNQVSAIFNYMRWCKELVNIFVMCCVAVLQSRSNDHSLSISSQKQC
jgi:hypothetical protein